VVLSGPAAEAAAGPAKGGHCLSQSFKLGTFPWGKRTRSLLAYGNRNGSSHDMIHHYIAQLLLYSVQGSRLSNEGAHYDEKG
jgi:hypothetical protein